MVEGVWGSRKEGGNDLLLLREKKNTVGRPGVGGKGMDSGLTPLPSPSHCISGPLYKLNGQDGLI